MFSNHNEAKLEINNKEDSWKILKYLEIKNILVTNTCTKEEVWKNIEYSEQNENENMIYQNLWI